MAALDLDRLNELRAFMELEPYSRDGMLLAGILAEVHRNSERRGEPFTESDFVFYPRPVDDDGGLGWVRALDAHAERQS